MMVAVLLVAVALLLLAFWIRAAGTAVTRVPRADALRDASDGAKGAEAVAGMLDEREVISPAVGVVASALLILSSVLATAVLVVGQSSGVALLYALGVGGAALLVGDLVPRRLGRLKPRSVAYRSARLLRLSVRLGRWANDLLPESEHGDDHYDDAGEDEADEHERELIDSVLEFSETIVREVMTPRPDMVTIPVTAPIERLIELSTEEGHSRLPVISNGDVVGQVIMMDLLSVLTDENRPRTVAQVMRPVEFVPETKRASSLLAEMQESHTHQVIVVDEYGDVAGLVTIEDLLEELVGEIADETDLEESLISRSGDGWDVDARLSVDDLVKATGVELPDEEWDTVGGLVLGLAERIPEEGEVFTHEQLILRVSRMQGRRVSEVNVTLAGRIEAV
ncbi:MAG: HlyC/CorC family transporter [Acidobacteria bacterium]|nr:HlyC/CorC family transporter [Acidobacteriota bacterium]TDI53112.1 MAG: HlyC/CorC family transporter [Acidobacteriota bacterium]TDI54741.1 MAG: HlyC/CorC family transporter [Acidobacteriota bacterium]